MGHDRMFKELLQTFFIEFLDLFLPDVSAFIDRDSIEFLDKEIFTDVTAGEQHEVDLLVKAKFRGQETCFLIHVEMQATSMENFAERIFRYFARLYEKFRLPVYPIALFSFDRPLRLEPDRFQVAFPNRVVLDFHFETIQLNQLHWRDFLRQPNPVAAALMTTMRIAPDDRPKVKLECLRLLVTLKLDRARQTLIRGFMDAYLRLSGEELRRYNEELQTIDPPTREAVMDIVNEWEEIGENRGIAIGEARGVALGEAKGQANVILRQLRRRFGNVSPELEGRIRALPTPKLDQMAEALLDFAALGEAEAWVAANP